MTQPDSNLRDSFRDFDQPVAPSPHLAHKIGNPAIDLDDSLPIGKILLAAALVLFVMGAAVVSLRYVRPANSPEFAVNIVSTQAAATTVGTPAANGSDPAAMYGGSPAQDGSYPGIAPNLATLHKLWESPAGTSGNAYFYGDTLYVQTYRGPLTAYDAATGAIRWQVPISWSQHIAVDQHGIYVALPGTETGTEGGTLWTMPRKTEYYVDRVALLGAATGQLIWQSATSFQLDDSTGGQYRLIATDGLVIAQVSPSQFVALDPETGKQRWKYTIDPEIDCVLSGYTCSSTAVTANGTLYVSNPANHQILAIDLADGKQQWFTVLPPELYQDVNTAAGDFLFVTLAASSGGVLAFVQTISSETYVEPTYLFLDRVSGEVAWSRPVLNGYLILSDTTAIVTVATDDGPAMQTIDLATGTFIGEPYQIKASSDSIAMLLPASSVFVAGVRTARDHPTLLQRLPVVGRFFGTPEVEGSVTFIDTATFQELGSATFKNCYVDTAFSNDGKLICMSPANGGFAVYGP